MWSYPSISLCMLVQLVYTARSTSVWHVAQPPVKLFCGHICLSVFNEYEYQILCTFSLMTLTSKHREVWMDTQKSPSGTCYMYIHVCTYIDPWNVLHVHGPYMGGYLGVGTYSGVGACPTYWGTYRTYFIGFRCMPYMQNKMQAGQSIVQASIMTGEDIVYYFVYSNYRFSE